MAPHHVIVNRARQFCAMTHRPDFRHKCNAVVWRLQERYPNLTKQQIVDRIEAIARNEL